MKKSTKIFLVMVTLLLLNVILSLVLTFSVPLDSEFYSLEYMYQNKKTELSFFIISGLLVIVIDFYLLFGFKESINLLPPFTLAAIFGFFAPFLFLSLYFVQRPYQKATDDVSYTIFSIIPLIFINLTFFLGMAVINGIVENIKAAKRKIINP